MAVVFVAPDSAERTFDRLARAAVNVGVPKFHTLLLGPASQAGRPWSIDDEVRALRETIGANDDVVAYSGGAAMCLALASRGGCMRSLTLIETPWVGAPLGVEGERFAARFDSLVTMPAADLVSGFFDLFAPGYAPELSDSEIARVAPPLRTVWAAYRSAALDVAALASFPGPVLLPYATNSAQLMRGHAEHLARGFPLAQTLEIAGAHHFNILAVAATAIAERIAA